MRRGHAILNMVVFSRDGGIWELLGIHIFVESVTGTENNEYKSPEIIKCLRPVPERAKMDPAHNGGGRKWYTKEPMRSQSFQGLRAPGRTVTCIVSKTGNYYTHKRG